MPTNEANVADTIPPGRRRTRSTTWLPPRVENSTIELTAIVGVAHVTPPPPDDGRNAPPVWRVSPQSPVEIAEVIRWCGERHLAVVDQQPSWSMAYRTLAQQAVTLVRSLPADTANLPTTESLDALQALLTSTPVIKAV